MLPLTLHLRRPVVLTRTELDARNSKVREATVWEMLSDKWNDDNYHPETSTSGCHEDFSSPISLDYSKVEDLSSASPEKVENKFAEMRANLIRIINQWNRSGQGDGGRDVSDLQVGETGLVREVPSAYGSLDAVPAQALDNRKNFLNGKPSYILYFWELADHHQLLASAVQRLSNSVGAADAERTPSVVNVPSRRRASFDSDAVGSGLQAMADNQEAYRVSQERIQQRQINARRREYLSQRMFHLLDTLRELRLRRAMSTNDRETEALSLEIIRIEREESQIQEELNSFVGDSSNITGNKRRRVENEDTVSSDSSTT